MTNEERREAIDIVEEYKHINADIEDVIASLDRLTREKDSLMERLEQLKTKEAVFMQEYRQKYGDRNLLADLNMEVG
jgi:hypothetical protein